MLALQNLLTFYQVCTLWPTSLWFPCMLAFLWHFQFMRIKSPSTYHIAKNRTWIIINISSLSPLPNLSSSPDLFQFIFLYIFHPTQCFHYLSDPLELEHWLWFPNVSPYRNYYLPLMQPHIKFVFFFGYNFYFFSNFQFILNISKILWLLLTPSQKYILYNKELIC